MAAWGMNWPRAVDRKPLASDIQGMFPLLARPWQPYPRHHKRNDSSLFSRVRRVDPLQDDHRAERG